LWRKPYAARFPFETWILAQVSINRTSRTRGTAAEQLSLGSEDYLRKLEKALEHPPYSLLVHMAPLQETPNPQLPLAHSKLFPKLTRVGVFEWGTGFYINPTPPEESAKFLREAGLG